MGEIWTDADKFQTWLQVEIAVRAHNHSNLDVQ
jgi:adenylosuccinate lyase